MLEERSEPARIRQVIGELPKAVPFLAVDEVHPRSDLAETSLAEDIMQRFHCNALNELDSLLSAAYAYVMSVTVLEHYNNPGVEIRGAASLFIIP
jgi:2-polyprenyl-3-methyl-5-hydroxy-6-metoxy-1,4-benzoquinol methylase